MKRILTLIIIVTIFNCCENKSKLNLSDTEVKKVKKELRDYMIYCKNINEDPSFDYDSLQNYISILNYKGSYDSICKIKKSEKEVEMIQKAIKLNRFNISSCSSGENFTSFGINRPKINMLTSLVDFRYIGLLNDSIINSPPFKNGYKLLEVKDSLYYFMDNW